MLPVIIKSAELLIATSKKGIPSLSFRVSFKGDGSVCNPSYFICMIIDSVYERIKKDAKKLYGSDSKPLTGRYFAEQLTSKNPEKISPYIEQLIEKIENVEWKYSCLKQYFNISKLNILFIFFRKWFEISNQYFRNNFLPVFKIQNFLHINLSLH